MPPYTTIRIASVAITILLVYACPTQVAWLAVVFSLAFGHYAASFWYSRRRAAALASRPRTWPAIAVAAALGTATYLAGVPVAVYFALHYVFNDVYARERALPEVPRALRAKFFTSTVAANFAIYAALFRDNPDVRFARHGVVFALLGATLACFAYYLAKIAPHVSRRQAIDNCAFEVLALAVVALSYRARITVLHVACLHFVVWWLMPAWQMRPQGRARVANFAVLSAALTALALLVSPVGLAPVSLSLSVFYQQFELWSFVHITASFALSQSHPAWITRWFALAPSPPTNGARLDLAPEGAGT